MLLDMTVKPPHLQYKTQDSHRQPSLNRYKVLPDVRRLSVPLIEISKYSQLGHDGTHNRILNTHLSDF